jgi:DNA-binding MarR family transcriptional regulator
VSSDLTKKIEQAAARLFAVENPDLDTLSREELIMLLNTETRAESAWTVFFHNALASRLKLNPTDHKCLDMIWRSFEASAGLGPCMTPGQLAKETKLTTGAVTGVLDRLEQAGYILREHDEGDRRRIIIRPCLERIKSDVAPRFSWIYEEYMRLCDELSDEDLRKMIDFRRKSQRLLQHAIDHLNALEE